MPRTSDYFPHSVQIARDPWDHLELGRVRAEMRRLGAVPDLVFFRHVAARLNRQLGPDAPPVHARLLNLYGLLARILRHVVDRYAEQHADVVNRVVAAAAQATGPDKVTAALAGFVRFFPPTAVLDGQQAPGAWLADEADPERGRRVLREALLLRAAAENPALDSFRILLDDHALARETPYLAVAAAMEEELRKAPAFGPSALSLPDLLREAARKSPQSLVEQVDYLRTAWADFLPPELVAEAVAAFDLIHEEEREWWGHDGAGAPPQVLEFGPGGRRSGAAEAGYPEPEAFSPDADWMSNVVLMAKMVYVWLDQLSKKHGREIRTLDQIPDEELDRLARWGFTGLWLIGLWERSPASQRIKQIAGNPDAISSAYSLFDYVVAHDLGGEAALWNLKERCSRRGIRLASDMVPNHTGLFSRWTLEHPDWFIQQDYPPYPNYRFTGPDLSFDGRVGLYIEDGYWERRDAAVTFQHVDRSTGRVRYIYHGNDGTSTPWNDTAQLNYLLPEVREAVIQTILHVARQFPIIRFDAAMTLAKLHYQRLWYPQPGTQSGVPSRAERGMTREEFDRVFPVEFWREVVDRVAAEAPGTLLLAEAFWLMEGYFVRTLGMHRVYNSAFMNMLKMEENAKYRQTVRNVLDFNPEIVKRFVNFMNNPDERTAVEQFGKEGKYVGAAVLLVTMPGLPMFGHGQVEGFHEKYGMEYRRAYWDEPVDEHLVWLHEAKVFPLMRKRYLFSGSENFALYDFFAGDRVNEDVFAYSNRAGAERGLILFHNRFASTAGWIRTSTSMMRRDADGNPATFQTTLGEALGLDPDGRCYYAFRDWNSGLEYLRSGGDLVGQGLWVELGSYEYKAFLDWREIRDDDFGTWGRLNRQLDGAGVPSLDEAVKGVRYGAVHAALRPFLEDARTLQADLFGPEAGAGTPTTKAPQADRRQKAREAIAARVAALAEALGSHGGTATPAAAAERFATLVQAAEDGQATPSSALAPEVPGDEAGRLALLAGLALRAAGEGLSGATWLDEMGLSRLLDEAGARDAHLPAPVLAKTLVCTPNPFGFRTASERAEAFRSLFLDPAARVAMRLHESGGIDWFHQESFDDLLAWLWRLAVIETRAGDALAAPDQLASLDATLALARAAARAAGFRADAFDLR